MTRYLFLDTETSGLPNFHSAADDASQPHIVQLGLLLTDKAFQPIERWCSIIKPNGWTVDAGAEAVHGISTRRAMEEGVPIAEAVERYIDYWESCDEIYAFSARFDMKLIRGELRRCGEDDRIGQRPIVDVMQAVRQMVGARGAKGQVKAPKLTEAFIFFGGSLTGNEHDAGQDCEMTRFVAKAFTERGGQLVGDPTLEFSKKEREAGTAPAAPKPPRGTPVSEGGLF